MDKIIKKKKGMELVTSLQNKFRRTPLLVMYYLTKFDNVI